MQEYLGDQNSHAKAQLNHVSIKNVNRNCHNMLYHSRTGPVEGHIPILWQL